MKLSFKAMKENQKNLLGKKGKLKKWVGTKVPVGIECKVVGYDKLSANLVIEVDDLNGWHFKLPNIEFIEQYKLPENKSLLYANETEIEFY